MLLEHLLEAILLTFVFNAKAQADVTELNSTELNYIINSHIGFEQNLGQLANLEGNPVYDVKFFIRLPNWGIFLREEGVSYVLNTATQEENSENYTVNYARIDLEPVDGRIGQLEYEEEVPGYSNYYLPQCPDGILEVKTYRKIRIKNVYDGIDWVWRFGVDGMHHEFEVSPGADISKIKLRIKYADVEITDDGKRILLKTPLGELEDGRIFAYENSKNVKVKYVMEDGFISFEVKDWSGKEKLTIDPPLSLFWGTYYGGNAFDEAKSICNDANGNICIVGQTASLISFPTRDYGGGAYFQATSGGADDIFILKFNNNGVRLWATYYGGDSIDVANSISTNGTSNILITGKTNSTNFPTYNPGGRAYYQGSKVGNYDAFILQFSIYGQRQWATYYGGSNYDEGTAINVDHSGNIFVVGYTLSSDFNTYNPGGVAYYQSWSGNEDGFIIKFTESRGLSWATFYGGAGYDMIKSLSINGENQLLITGTTTSPNFPTFDPGNGTYFQSFAGGYDAFILKFNNSGQRLWATFYGGTSFDYGNSIKADVSGNIFLVGNTLSTNFPTQDPGGTTFYQGTNGGNSDAFVVKFDSSGVRTWSTYYGGSGNDYAYSLCFDNEKNILITGRTTSTNFPTLDYGYGAFYQDTIGGNNDAFLLGFTNTGTRLWATYLGGNGDDYGYSISSDNNSNIFTTGSTKSTNFPTRNPGGNSYFQGSLSSQNYPDLYILKFEEGMTLSGENLGKTNLLIQNIFRDKILATVKGDVDGEVDIYLYDITGRLLLKESRHGNTFTISGPKVVNLPHGVYFVKVYSRGKLLGNAKTIKIKG